MPRLTDALYLDHRQRLMVIWDFRSSLLAELETFEQRDLHRFYAMSHEMYDDDALAYRREVTKRESSLPNQAGRAYAHLLRVVLEDREHRARQIAVSAEYTKSSSRTLTVKALAKPEIDTVGIGKVLAVLASSPELNKAFMKARNNTTHSLNR